MKDQKDLVEITEEYYNSKSADEFYYRVWGGEDIHIGIYENQKMPILDASRNTVKKMASMAGRIKKKTRILDIGAGYGGAARYLADTFGCRVTCLNLSEVENQRNREKNSDLGLDRLIEVVQGNFENLPFEDESFDIVWAEDSILHSSSKSSVFQEVSRVLKSGGTFIFTDPMQRDDCPEGVLQPILDRIHLEELGSVGRYKKLACRVGLTEDKILEMPEQLVNHYSSVLENLEKNEQALRDQGCDREYIDKMKTGLNHWVEGGKKGYLNWGIIKFSKN